MLASDCRTAFAQFSTWGGSHRAMRIYLRLAQV
jgi:hypothetical protein